MVHQEKLKIVCPFCEIFNNFSSILVFSGSKSGIRDFVMVILGWLTGVYSPFNLHGSQTSLTLSYQLKILPINNCTITKNNFIIYSSGKTCNSFFLKYLTKLFSQNSWLQFCA